ncbi:MAG: (d)CMP kinase [Clostridia bacterium]|nr:(d)CMP kinase [Clostridia bacterium]
MTKKSIAIDGPAGAGKSTVAKLIAKELGYLYIDTGAMYRAVALLGLRQGIGVDDGEALAEIASQAKIELKNSEDTCRIFCDGEDISLAIRTAEVGAAASPVSAHLGVREALVAQQRRIAAENNVVMDGRDIGTNVIPDSQCKIYLTASLDERARRRTLDLQNMGKPADFAEVRAGIAERDYRDSHRQHSPLKQADDAYLIDSTNLTIDEVKAQILACAARKL